ncbi:PTS transporter subunit EIIC, partial [Pseudomonas sp. CrR25]|nr:PTS transporter subunit EIIC [Pseudomonas sp. CrR25]
LSVDAQAEAAQTSKPAGQGGPYKHLLTGVSYMLPMVVAGGLLIALSFVFGIEAFKQEGSLAAVLMQIGGDAAFKLMVPVLAGYIAYSIADRPGLAPGMIGGLLASTLGAGFIGGIIAGFIAGYAARGLNRWLQLPASVEALKPILIIPLLASLITGLVMVYVVGKPVAGMLVGLTDFLDSMGSTNAILLGLLLGGMMCVDLGGPINKAAYAFSVGLLASQSYAPMAATMAAGMVPPLGMAIASLLARHKFAESEREAGKAAGVLGLCFISEGAIPFAAKDPFRVIPASIAGGALTGALSMYFGCKLMAPHGGLFVLLIPNAINQAALYLLAIVAGSLLTGVVYALIKRGEAVELVAAGEKA